MCPAIDKEMINFRGRILKQYFHNHMENMIKNRKRFLVQNDVNSQYQEAT